MATTNTTKVSLLVKKTKKTPPPTPSPPAEVVLTLLDDAQPQQEDKKEARPQQQEKEEKEEEQTDLNMVKIQTSAEVIQLSDEQADDLIDKLETKRYELTKAGKSDSADMTEVNRLLSEIKKTDASTKVVNNLSNKSLVESEFKKSKKEMLLRDFQKIIDLTAPKEEREPDVTTTIWKTQRELSKGRTYKSAEAERIENFQKKMKHKRMPEQLEQAIDNLITDNLTGIALREKNADHFKYKKYDPFKHEQNGLSAY